MMIHGNFHVSAHPSSRSQAGGIMFSGCTFACACVHASGRLAVDF